MEDLYVLLFFIIFLSVCCLIYWIADYKDLRNSKRDLWNKYQSETRQHREAIEKLTAENKKLKKDLEENKNKFDQLIKRAKPLLDKKNKEILKKFKYVAEFLADADKVVFDECIDYLRTKSRPAYATADEVKKYVKEHLNYKKQLKAMRYEYDFLFSKFPELENYIEYYMGETNETLDDVKDDYDYVRNWLSPEEYNALSEIERNQLALDRYVESHKKTNWQIGRDYELFILQHYQNQGYNVEHIGVEKLDDMGRDLICIRGCETLIVQCKNWSKNKIIHEKHICQTYGTTQEYNFENQCSATPVLVSTTNLSDRALKFAKFLGVQVDIIPFDEEKFPRIKCNINGKKRIYHLPFDQQYDKTKIDKRGEFFALTVKEAVDKGFVRAKKHLPFVVN